jgi:four helix bundle protein
MAGAKCYQDLVCWQLADELEQLVSELTETGPASKDFNFREQIRDSSSSATRNMAEGFGRFFPAEHANFLRIAKSSLFETHNSARASGLIRYLESQIPPSKEARAPATA